MLIEEGSIGTFLGMGCPGADEEGWAKDNPPTKALFLCDSCMLEFNEDNIISEKCGDYCRKCWEEK